MPRISFDELKAEFKRVLLKKGCDEATADLSAQLMTETSCDGVYSHGVNRFPRVVEYIDKGYIERKLFEQAKGDQPCPGGGSYVRATPDIFPPAGQLYLACSLQTSEGHRPEVGPDW